MMAINDIITWQVSSFNQYSHATGPRPHERASSGTATIIVNGISRALINYLLSYQISGNLLDTLGFRRWVIMTLYRTVSRSFFLYPAFKFYRVHCVYTACIETVGIVYTNLEKIRTKFHDYTKQQRCKNKLFGRSFPGIFMPLNIIIHLL